MLGRLLLFLIGIGVTTDANAIYSKWSTRTQAAAQDWIAGAEATTKDPTQLAINAQQRAVTNYQAALNSGKWANALRAAGKQGWLTGIQNKSTNFSNGVANAQQKFVRAFGTLLTYENTLQQQIDAMPNITDTDRENRMLAWVRGMRQYTG